MKVARGIFEVVRRIRQNRRVTNKDKHEKRQPRRLVGSRRPPPATSSIRSRSPLSELNATLVSSVTFAPREGVIGKNPANPRTASEPLINQNTGLCHERMRQLEATKVGKGDHQRRKRKRIYRQLRWRTCRQRRRSRGRKLLWQFDYVFIWIYFLFPAPSGLEMQTGGTEVCISKHYVIIRTNK